MQSCVFSKHLQSLGIEELGAALKGIGMDAVDLTVRPGGHVEPDAAAEKLPEAVAALREKGVEIAMITTGITSLDDPDALTILKPQRRKTSTISNWGTIPFPNTDPGGKCAPRQRPA